MKVRVIDFETTQDDETREEFVCELGFSDYYVDEAVVIAPASALVDPNRKISPVSSGVHHITTDMVVGQLPLEEVGPTLLRDMNDGDLFAAHRIEYERRFFDGGGHKWLCTHRCAYDLYPDAPSHALQALRYYLCLEAEGMDSAEALPAHRAGPDAYVAAWLLATILKHTADGIPGLLATSNRPILLRKMQFGNKYWGRPFEEVDTGYLEFVIGLTDISDDLRHTCKHHLARRRQEHKNPFGV